MNKKRWITFALLLAFVCGESVLAQNKSYNLSDLEWKLWGYRPNNWRMFGFDPNKENGKADVHGIDVKVPGSVQKALLDANKIEDWNYGTNNEKIEWIENRNWLFTTNIPDEWIEQNKLIRLRFKGLDDNGTILLNGKEIAEFNNAFIPYEIDITPHLKEKGNVLIVAFDMPARYLGQICWTSKIKDWKPRYYYGWDWLPRIVQIGIWDDVLLEVYEKDDARIERIGVLANADRYQDVGELKIAPVMTHAAKRGSLHIELKDQKGKSIINQTIPAYEATLGKQFSGLKIKRWYPNGLGDQPLYNLTYTLFDENGTKRQTIQKKIGFKSVVWEQNEGAAKEADPWLCVVNNKPVFIQGINWTPIRPNFADLRKEHYDKLLKTYKDLGFNTIRVWGGGFAEKDYLYDLCDQYGLMIQQDFPLSSSGIDNYPPTDPQAIHTMGKIAQHYLDRNKHRVSIFIWCGGNELYEKGDVGIVTVDHPMIRRIYDVVRAEDPYKKFIPGSPSGANISASRENFGKGRNWDTHGPWTLPYKADDYSVESIKEYWTAYDGLMLSEAGAPGCQSVEMIHKYRANYPALPASTENFYWNQFNWWIEWDQYKREHAGKEPATLEEYVNWSQQNQINGLTIAMGTLKSKFPKCGGMIIWMGHDSYPCASNTSIIDFDGNLKPAALELKKILTTF